MHALFDKHSAVNQWSINSSFLRENLDFFSPKVEQLDICRENDRITFLSFTNKIVTAKRGKPPQGTKWRNLTEIRGSEAADEDHRHIEHRRLLAYAGSRKSAYCD
jgi:hypothetical protein